MEGPRRPARVRMCLVLALVVAVTGAQGRYTVQKAMNQCAGYCKGTAKFNYNTETIYHYDYEVDVSSSIEGATGPGDRPSQMMIRAKADLAALDSPCDLTLTLKDVNLLDPESLGTYGDTEGFAAALQKNPLRFSLQHGKVEELCSLPGEPTWVLNFKRGLLSSIQNSMDDLKVSQTVYETDIAGSCETRYTAFADMWWEEELWGGGGRGKRVKGATPMTTIRRTKDLASCSERTSYFLSLQANPTGRSKARHMLRSTHECEQSVSEEPEKYQERHSSSSSEEDEEDEEDEDEIEDNEEFTATKVGGILLRSECRERHLFEPFSYHGSGATTNVTTRLILRSKEPASPVKDEESKARARGLSHKGAVVPYAYSTLLYDHSADNFVGTPPEDVGGADAVQVAVHALRSVEAATAEGVSAEAPTSFAALIATLRRLSHSDLMKLFEVAATGRSRKFILDAMPVVATAASMSAFRDLHRSGEVSDTEMDSWMGGVAFLKRPTLPMIAAVTPLLEGDPRPNAVLGVTALVHSYCRYGGGDSVTPPSAASNPESNNSSEQSESSSSEEDRSTFGDASSSAAPASACREKPEVNKVIARLEEMLGSEGCRFVGNIVKREKRIAEAYLALKGLGNVGVPPSPEASESIARCYKDPDVPSDLRLAAVDVLRRVPCHSETVLRAQFVDTYANVSAGPKETEIRIAAYMASMKCASVDVVKRVKDTLEREEANQVGSFVWTHLTNLRSNPSSSSETYSISLSEIMASKKLRRKFRSDVRRFSRHYRVSTGDAVEPPGAGDWHSAFGGGGISALGAGADAEASVVLSPESYIPRSASLNLTVRLFGAEVDLLDVGARAEGLEPLVESMFGPAGGSSSSTGDSVVSRRSQKTKKQEDSSEGTARRFNEAFLHRKPTDHPVEPRGSGYVRVFGNELYYGRFRGLGEMLASFTSRVGTVDAATGRMRGMLRDPMAQLSVALAQQRELEFSRSLAFLDAALVVPTSAGLPLTLVANGTASVALSVRGRMDMTGRAEGNFDAEGVLAPSAALMVTGTMFVSASDVSRSGLRLDASLRTNTRAEGRLRYRRGKLAEASFTAPRDAGEEVVALRSELFALGRKAGDMRPLEGRREGREEAESCTPRTVSKAIGCELCAKASYPNATGDDTSPRFPLTGPALVSVALKKTDAFARYEIKYEYTDEAKEDERSEGRGAMTDDEYLEEMRAGGKRYKRVRNLLLYFDTPGSKVNRKIRGSLMMEGGVGGASLVQASVETPWTRTLEVVAGLENTASARGVGLTATLGGEEVVTAQAELRSVLRRPGSEGVGAPATPSGRYEPSVTVAVRGRTLIDLHGRVDYVHGSKYSGDLLLAGEWIREPVTISGDLTSDGGRYDLIGSVKSTLIEGTVQGNFKRTVGGPKKKGISDADRDAGKFVNAKATFKYSIRGGEEQTFEVSARYLRNAKGALAKDSAYLTVLSTQFPQYEIDATWDSSISEGPYFEGRGRLTLGKDGPRWETRPLLVLRGMDHLAFRFFLACRAKKLHYDISLKHQFTDQALAQHAILRMGTNHEFAAVLNFTKRSHPTDRYNAEIEVRLPKNLHVGQRSHTPGQRVLAMRVSVDDVRRRTYGVAGGVEWWWGSITGAAEVSGTYMDRGNRSNSDRRLDGKLWVVHGREQIDKTEQEPSLDFALRLTQADRRASVFASTEKPRKYKTEVHYAKTGQSEHTVTGWAELSQKKYDGKAVVSDNWPTKGLYLELGLGRRMSLDTKLHLGEGLNGFEVDLFWDKEYNQSLSTGATVEFLGVTSKLKPRGTTDKAYHGSIGSVWLEYPGRNIRGQGRIRPDEVTADLTWEPGRAISIAQHTERKEGGAKFSLSVQTPFQGIERQSASAVYTWDGKRFNGMLDANWRKEASNLASELTMVLPPDGASPWESNADLELHVTSTMESIRDAHIVVRHRACQSPLGTNTTAQIAWNGAEILFTNVAWDLEETERDLSLTGGALIRSAGPHLRHFGAKFDFGRRGDREADVTASLSWRRPYDTRNNGVDLGFSLSGLKSGEGYLNLSTNLGEYENCSAIFSYSSGDSGGRSVISSELYLDGIRSAVASVSGVFMAGGVANVDVNLEAPWFSAIEASLRHNFQDSEGLREQLEIKYGDRIVTELDIEAALRSKNDFVIRFTGGVSGTVGSTKIEHRLAPNTVRSLVEVTFSGETSSLLLQAHDEEGPAPKGQNWRPRVLHGSVTATSPRLRSGRLRFVVDFSRTGRGNFETAVLAPGIRGKHSFSMRDLLNWESRLECYRGWEGHVQLPVVNVTLINGFDGNSFSHFSHMYMRGLEQAITFDLNFAWGGENHPKDIALSGNVDFSLPWTHPISVNLEVPRSKTNEGGITVLQPKAFITYGEERKNLTIIARMERGGPLTTIISEVTMNGCQPMNFGVSYNFAAEKKTVHLFATMDDNERAETIVTFQFPNHLASNLYLKVSPAGTKEFTVISLDFDLLAMEKYFKLLTRTEKDNEILHKKLDILAKMKIDGWKVSGSTVIEAPIKRSIAFDIDLTNRATASLKVTKNGIDFFFLSGSGDKGRDSAKLSIDLTSQLEGMEKVSFVVAYDKIDGDHHLEAVFDRDAIKAILTGKLRMDESLTEIQAVIRLPMVGYEYVKAEAIFSNTPGPSFILEYQRMAYIYKISGNAETGAGYFNASLNIKTPFKGYESLDAKAQYSVDSNSRRTDLSVLLDFNGAQTSMLGAMASPTPSTMQGNIVILTPLRGFEKVDASLYYDASRRGQLDAKAHLITMYGTSSVIFSGKIEEDTKSYEGRLLISSPYLPGSIGTFGLEAEYQAKKRGELRINIGNQIPTYTVTIAAIEGGTTAIITTPILGYRKLSFTMERDLINKTAATVLLTREDDKYKVSGIIENSKNHSASVSMKVETAIPGWEDISVHVSYDFPPGKEMKAGFEAQRNQMSTFVSGRVTGRLSRKAGRASAVTRWNFASPEPSEFSVDGIYDMAATEKSLEMNAKTPFQGFENLQAKARVERENGFALFTMPSVSYLIKGKREGDKSGHFIFSKNRNTLLFASATLDRGREFKFQTEVNCSLPGYEGRLETAAQWNRLIGRVYSLNASGIFNVEGFRMNGRTSVDVTLNINKPDQGSALKMDISTPLVSFLEKFYLSAEYSGNGKLAAKANTVFEGYEDVEGTATWEMSNLYSVAITARRGEEIYVSHNEMEKIPGLFRVTTNLTTPIEGFEELGSITRFFWEEENENTWNVEVEIKTLLYDEVMLGVEGHLRTKEKALDTEVILNTINPGYETINSKFEYDFEGYNSDGSYIKANAEAEGRTFFSGSGVYKDDTLRLKLSAPPITSKEIDGVAVFNDWRNSEIRVRVGEVEGNVLVNIPTNHEGKIKFVSNVQGYELIEAAWKKEIVANIASTTEASAKIGEDKRVQFTLKHNPDLSNLESEVKVNMPGNKNYGVFARWELLPDTREFQGRVDATWAELGKVFEVEMKAEAPQGRFSGDVKAKGSQWRNGKETTLSLVLEYAGLDAKAESLLKWGDSEKEMVRLKGKLEVAALQAVSNLEFTTPFTEPLFVSLDYDFADESPKSVTANYRYGVTSYSVTGKVNKNEFDFELETPVTEYSKLKIKGSKVFDRYYKEVLLMYELGRETKGEMKASAKSELKNPYEVNLFASVHGSNKWSVEAKLATSGPLNLSGNLDMKWGDDGNLKFQVEWIPPEKVRLEVNLSEWVSPVIASWELEGPKGNNKGVNLEVIFQSGISVDKRIRLIAALTPDDSGKTLFEVNLETPGENGVWTARGNVSNKKGNSFEMDATLLRGGTTLANVQGTMQHQAGSHTKISLKGGSAVFESGYDVRNDVKEAHLLAIYGNSHKIDAKANGVLDTGAARASLSVETSFTGLKKLKVEGKLGGMDDERDAELRAEWESGRVEITARGAFVEETGAAKGRFAVRTPWNPLKNVEMEATAKIKGPRYEVNATMTAENDFAASFDAILDLELYEAECNAAVSGPQGKSPIRFHASVIVRPKELLKIRLETPFMVMVDVSGRRVEDAYDVISDAIWGEGQKMKLKGKLRSLPEDYGFNGELELNGKRIAIDAFTKGGSLPPDNGKIEGGFSLVTPYHQFSHMNMYFSLLKERSKLLDGRLNMTTPFEALPRLSATLSMKESDRGLTGELRANADSKYIRVSTEIRKDLLGKNALNIEVDLPLLGKSSPLTFECSLQNDRPDWREVAVEARASISNATYGASLAYAFVNYRIQGSFSLLSPSVDYRGGVSGSHGNNSLIASAYFKENALKLFYQLDKSIREITGNVSFTAPDLGISDASVTLTAAFLEDIIFFSSYKFGNTSGLIDVGYNGRGLVANMLVPPMLNSKVTFKFLLIKESRKYNVDSEFSHGDSKHMLQLSIEMVDHLIVNGKLLSTSWGDRDIDIYLRNNKKIGKLSVSGFIGGSWDASQPSAVAFSFMWKGIEHRGKVELKTVGRYAGGIELSSPWLPTGGVNASAFYSNEIDALKAEIKCETKRGMHSIYLENGENDRRKSLKVKIMQYSNTLLDVDASVTLGEGLADASGRVKFKNSTHRAGILLKAYPITMQIELDSDFLKKTNPNPLSINSTINIDEMKGHICIQTPYSFLELANFTASSWFTNNGHLLVETAAIVRAKYQGAQRHQIAIATMKLPYPYAQNRSVKQYMLELNVSPGNNKFLGVFDYEVQEKYGHVNAQLQLSLDNDKNEDPILYDIKTYGKINKEESHAEASGLLVWAGKRYGELEFEFGKNKFEDGFVLSSLLTISEEEKYQGFMDIGQQLGKIEIQWPKVKTATIDFERDIEGWEAFRVGLSMKTPFDVIKDVSLKLKSVVTEDGYEAELFARKEEQGIAIKVDGAFANDASNFLLEGGVTVNVNGARLFEVSGHGRFLCDGVSLGLDWKSKWEDFQDLHFLGGADWSLKGEKGPSLKLEISYNSRELLALAADCSYKTFSGGAHVRTLWTLPASMRYELDFHSIQEMNGVARMCYGHCVGINFTLNGTKEISARMELPTRILGADWAWKASPDNLHCSARLTWKREHSLGFNLNLLTKVDTKMLLEIDLPVRSFRLEAKNGIIGESNASYSNVTFYWDAARNTSKSISVGMTILKDKESGNIESVVTITHPALRRDIVLRVYCSPLQLPFWGRLELEYSPNEADLFVSRVRLEGLKVVAGQAKTVSLLVTMRHQSSGLDVRIGAQGAAGSDKAGGQLVAKYVDARGRERTIVLSAKAHRIRRSLQLKADTNENSLSVRATLEDIGLRLETKVNRKPPLMLRFLVDREMPSASFEADHGRRRYKVYFGSTEKAGSGGPIKSITARLSRRDVDDDAPPSTISVAPSVETVLSGTTVSLNTSRVLSTRFLWEQRGGLRTPDVPATLSAASLTMGGWIREAYSDVGHAWAAVAGEAAAGFLGEGTTHKLRFWYLSIEDEVEGFSTYSRYEVNSLVEDFRSLEEMMSEMYSRNDFFIQDIDRFVVSGLDKVNVATSCVSKFFKEAINEAYVVLCKATSAILASASRLVGDAIETTGSAVSSALPDPAEAARRLGEAAGRVAMTARRVGAAVRGAARRLALWAEGVVECVKAWAEERRARASQAVWDWAAAEAERMRPAILIFHSYVLRFKEIVEEVHQVADDISISIGENLANVREIMEIGEMVDYYTFKVRHLEWNETTARVKAYFKRTWETIKEDFRNGLGEYREIVMEKYTELIGRYDQFMQLPQVVEFTGTVKFLRRKAVWTWHYLELGDHLQRMITNFLMDEVVARVVTELASQMISEASRDPNRGSDSLVDTNVDTHIRGTDRSYALEAGYFEYNIKLPFDWDSFDSVPHFRQMWEGPKESGKSHRSEEQSSGQNRPGSTAFTRLKTVVADALLDASSAKALMDATDGEMNAAAALAALALPPFPASALVAGDTHFVTFDGRDYSFSSAASCSYLLAADLEGGTFSLLANYNDKGHRRSVSVIVPAETSSRVRGTKVEERRIDVAADGRVSVDGRREELPIDLGSATVGKEGERVVVEVGRPAPGAIPRGVAPALDALQSSSASMILDCNPFHNVCTVRISGWIFSRTGGLLGTYNNEPSDDFETPDGRTVYSKGQEKEFAESWRVGNCTGEVGAVGAAIRTPSTGIKEAPSALATATGPCDAFFDRELDILSPLQPCFSRVDPAPYGRLCEMDAAAASNSPSRWEAAACSAAAAYVAQCRNAGMDIWVPQTCVKCHLSDGSVMSAGETKIYGGDDSDMGSPAPHNGDVVFLVEQRPCLRGTNIANLAIKLDTAMRTRGLRDNRFVLVGFNGGYSSAGRSRGAGGGKMASRVFGGPHTHTVDGKIWSNKRHFEKAFHNMQFDGREGTGPGGRTTPIEAMWYAARLPFRDGVSKTVVLIMCGDCRDATDAAYADTAGMLVEEGITLHILAPTILRTRRQPSTGPPVAIGFDSGGAFTTRNVRSLVPNRDLKRQLAIPKDLCSPLALETNGTRFDVGIVLGGPPPPPAAAQIPAPERQASEKEVHAEEMRKKRQRKFAMDVFVRRVALTASPTSCQKCDCVANREGVGRVACQRCLSPTMDQFIKDWDKMMSEEIEDSGDDMESMRALSSLG